MFLRSDVPIYAQVARWNHKQNSYYLTISAEMSVNDD